METWIIDENTFDCIYKLALYPGKIPRREPPSCEAPRQTTIYACPVCLMIRDYINSK